MASNSGNSSPVSKFFVTGGGGAGTPEPDDGGFNAKM